MNKVKEERSGEIPAFYDVWIELQIHDILPRQDIQLTSKTENRVFFVDEGFENNEPRDVFGLFSYIFS